MEVIYGRTFQNQAVQMDGRHFSHCTMINCILDYSGKPVTLEDTEFQGCQFRFTGDASLTVNFLRCFGMLHADADFFMVTNSTVRST